jgi:hypothetical protein
MEEGIMKSERTEGKGRPHIRDGIGPGCWRVEGWGQA